MRETLNTPFESAPREETLHVPLSAEGLRLRKEADAVPGGDKIPADALEREAKELQRFASELRSAERRKVLKRLGKMLGSVAGFSLVVGALQGREQIDTAMSDVEAYRLLMGTETIDRATLGKPTDHLEGLPSPDVMREELTEAFGRERLNDAIPVEGLDRIGVARKLRTARESISEALDVTGLQEHFGIPNEALQDVVTETTPVAWHSSLAVKDIKVRDHDLPMPKGYGSQKTARGTFSFGTGSHTGHMELGLNAMNSGELSDIVIHELTHGGDWRSANVMAPEDRLALLYAVHGRTRSVGRIRFPYVESIQNPDQKEEVYKKTEEYFAELLEMALTIPAEHREEWSEKFFQQAAETMTDAEAKPVASIGEEDLRIVEWYFRTIDPDFRPWEAAKQRNAMTREVMVQALGPRIRASLEHVPSPTMRMLLMRAFEGERKSDMMRLLDTYDVNASALSDESRAYALAFDEHWVHEMHVFSKGVPDRLQPAFEWYREARDTLDAIGKNCDSFWPVTDSKAIADIQKSVDRIQPTLKDLSKEDTQELDKIARDWDRLKRGDIDMTREPPKQLVSMLERLSAL